MWCYFYPTLLCLEHTRQALPLGFALAVPFIWNALPVRLVPHLLPVFAQMSPSW